MKIIKKYLFKTIYSLLVLNLLACIETEDSTADGQREDIVRSRDTRSDRRNNEERSSEENSFSKNQDVYSLQEASDPHRVLSAEEFKYQKAFKAYYTEKNYAEAFSLFQELADQGHAESQYNLGRMYYNRHGVSKSYKKALAWYTLSANQGYDRAQNNLGVMYDTGKGFGIPRDRARAYELYKKSAAQNNIWAQNNLGMVHYYTKGGPQHYEEAFKWFKKAATNTDAKDEGEIRELRSAQYNVGYMYYHGIGVSKDIGQAKIWLQKAANQGFSKAQNLLHQINRQHP